MKGNEGAEGGRSGWRGVELFSLLSAVCPRVPVCACVHGGWMCGGVCCCAAYGTGVYVQVYNLGIHTYRRIFLHAPCGVWVWWFCGAHPCRTGTCMYNIVHSTIDSYSLAVYVHTGAPDY